MFGIAKIGIIGGSGIDDSKIMPDAKKIKVNTPFGATSDLVTVGTTKGVSVVVIPRHGDGHRINPSNINYRANIWALKELGVTHVIAPTACGSLREDIKPGHLIFIDQFIDRTTRRMQTFYEGTEVCHIPMSEPFCPYLRKILVETAKKLDLEFHKKGTMVTIEGPRFSTKAESHLFRNWNCDAINMTTVPECVLARELGIHYQPVAMSTDYDCWHESHEPVTIDMIISIMKKNSENVRKLIMESIPLIKDKADACTESIKTAKL